VADRTDDSQILDYFEASMKDFIVKSLSGTDDWWGRCVPHQVRSDAQQRCEQARSMNDVLNKLDCGIVEYVNFDGYERIISRRDNWRNHVERIFVVKSVFDYKVRIIQSLRNDVRHGRKLDAVNRIRLRLHCYDILSQVLEAGLLGEAGSDELMAKCGLDRLS